MQIGDFLLLKSFPCRSGRSCRFRLYWADRNWLSQVEWGSKSKEREAIRGDCENGSENDLNYWWNVQVLMCFLVSVRIRRRNRKHAVRGHLLKSQFSNSDHLRSRSPARREYKTCMTMHQKSCAVVRRSRKTSHYFLWWRRWRTGLLPFHRGELRYADA